MKPFDHIIKQLIEQQIEFEIIQNKPIKSSEDELSKTVFAWRNKFIRNKKAPYLNQNMWHIFSYEVSPYLEKEAAIIELKKQYLADTFIFNERLQFLIQCKNGIPFIKMIDFIDDIYISHHNMKWTYVITHEDDLGPYFSTGV